VGQPNVGKSSLLNQILGHDRAIVSPQPGTTRDTIEAMANVRGIPVLFVDTAGLRNSNDAIEREGVRRSEGSVALADLILHVLDSSVVLGEGDRRLSGQWEGRKRIVVGNKCDLPRRVALPQKLAAECVWVSALTGEGVDELLATIEAKVWGGEVRAEMTEVMINARHQEALSRARVALKEAEAALSADRPLELVASDLRLGLNAVGEVVGKTTTDDLLDRIFSQFCLGK
jgi:tRNA modification GTPase